ncbi:hypothetical protein GOODEAATRI_008776, partial [Goodea atripinnis]
ISELDMVGAGREAKRRRKTLAEDAYVQRELHSKPRDPHIPQHADLHACQQWAPSSCDGKPTGDTHHPSDPYACTSTYASTTPAQKEPLTHVLLRHGWRIRNTSRFKVSPTYLLKKPIRRRGLLRSRVPPSSECLLQVEGHSEAQMVLQFPGHDLHAQRKTLLTQAQRTLGNREPEDVQDT